MSPARFLLALSLAAVAFAIPTPFTVRQGLTLDACNDDAPCLGARACIANVCLPAEPQRCTSTQDCEAGEACISGSPGAITGDDQSEEQGTVCASEQAASNLGLPSVPNDVRPEPETTPNPDDVATPPSASTPGPDDGSESPGASTPGPDDGSASPGVPAPGPDDGSASPGAPGPNPEASPDQLPEESPAGDDTLISGGTGSGEGEGDDEIASSPAPTSEEDEVCIDAAALAHLRPDQLVFTRHTTARVLCDAAGSCATRGHIVSWNGSPMMMRTYCQAVGCEPRVIKVNSPRYERRFRVPSKTTGLEYTAFAARYETAVEEHMLKAAVRVGL